MSQFYSLPVASVSRSTRDAVVVAFTVPDDLQDVFQFRPGQYLTLRTHLDGQELRRSYSICAAPHDRLLRVAIKRVNDGAFSTWANSHLEAGASLEVMPPDGNFTVDFDPSQAHRYAAFAVGSGITPILSLVKTALAGEDPNWGRIVMAVGKSGAQADRDRLSITFGTLAVATNGLVDPGYKEADGAAYMKNSDLEIGVDLGLGKGRATVWTCDLTHRYIDINADYRS